MADVVHVTPERNARRIVRSGIAARSAGGDGERGVYCMPVLESFTLTYQWVREMRRWHAGPFIAVHARIPDDEPVTVGHYGRPSERVGAARAAGIMRALADPRGYQVFVPRSLAAGEIRYVRAVPPGVGWPYQPDAHGRRPCTCPACAAKGTYGAARLRQRFPDDEPRQTKPQLMARLAAATTSDEIIDVLVALGARSRGGAHELEYLVDHPDAEVRRVLAVALESYRGGGARRLRERLIAEEVER